jgi:HK97 family phage major capsid protein
MKKEELKTLLKELEDEGSEADKAEEKAESTVEAGISADKIAEQVAEKIVSAMAASQGGNSKDVETVKEKIYTPEEGLKAVRYPELSELGNLSDDEKIAVYFKALLTRQKTAEDMAVIKGLSEGTAADGGNLVPTPLFTEVARLIADRSVMRRIARIVPMTSDTLKIPTQTADPLAYWIGERVTKTTTSAEFSYVTLNSNKLVARILVSEELNDDAIVAMVPYVTELFAEAIAVAEDKAFFTGADTTEPRGITAETLTNQAASATFSIDDVVRLMYLVRQSVRLSPSCAFIAHQDVIRKLQVMKDSNNQYLWRTGGLNNGQVPVLPDMLFNKPIYEQNDLPSRRLYWGDWSKYYIGDRKQLYIKTTDQNETAWTQDAIDIKAVERVDGRAALTTAFAYLTNC